MQLTCPCDKEFWAPPNTIGRKKYCSKSCFYKFRKIPIWNKGLKGIHLSPATEFKKGQKPWNTGVSMDESLKENLAAKNKGKRFSPSTEFNSSRTKGELNAKWKGDEVGYFASHGWVSRTYGRADKCENRIQRILGFSCSGKSSRYEWAYKDKIGYERNREKYFQLCKSCHTKYDRS